MWEKAEAAAGESLHLVHIVPREGLSRVDR
jgi:hypothetical protein